MEQRWKCFWIRQLVQPSAFCGIRELDAVSNEVLWAAPLVRLPLEKKDADGHIAPLRFRYLTNITLISEVVTRGRDLQSGTPGSNVARFWV